MMVAFADDLIIANDDRADRRIRRGVFRFRAPPARRRVLDRARRAASAGDRSAPRVVAVRHRNHYRFVNDSARLANRVGAVAQRRAGRADVVEERHPPSRDARRVAGETPAGGEAFGARASALRVARALIEREHDARAGDFRRAARRQGDAVESAHVAAAVSVVGTGTSIEPAATSGAAMAPSASATSRRPSLSASTAARRLPSYGATAVTRNEGQRTVIGAARAAGRPSHSPEPRSVAVRALRRENADRAAAEGPYRSITPAGRSV